MRVEDAPGLLNKLFGKGKRWLAIASLALAAIISLCVALNAKREVKEVVESFSDALNAAQDRHQIYGDPVLMDDLEKSDFSTVFADAGDRYLARFAIPGTEVRFENANWRQLMASALENTLASDIVVCAEDPREIRELKQIVMGIRDEMRGYLSNGVGTYATFIKRLEERQLREIQIFNQAKADLDRLKDSAEYERINASLRRMGLRTILEPRAHEYQ